MLLEGIFLPLTTPFHADGHVFLSKLEANVERYSRTPAAGMVVLGGAGEGGALSDRETGEVLRAALRAAADEKVMIAGVARESVAAALEVAAEAAVAGYDAIAVRAPACCGATGMELELLTFFQMVADRARLPVVLVSDSERSISAGMMGRLAGHPQMIGAIVSEVRVREGEMREVVAATRLVSREVTVTNVFAAVTGRMLRRAGTGDEVISAESLGGGGAALAASGPRLKTRTKRVGFQVLAGSTGGMLGAWKAGAAGAVPPLGACAPQACCEVWQAFRDGDEGLAAEKQERVHQSAGIVEGVRGTAALKYGCDLNGYFGGRPRLPLLPLRGEEREAVERALAGIKN